MYPRKNDTALSTIRAVLSGKVTMRASRLHVIRKCANRITLKEPAQIFKKKEKEKPSTRDSCARRISCIFGMLTDFLTHVSKSIFGGEGKTRRAIRFKYFTDYLYYSPYSLRYKLKNVPLLENCVLHLQVNAKIISKEQRTLILSQF